MSAGSASSPLPVAGETDTADNSLSTLVTVELALTDVAISNVSAPASAAEGDLVVVDVTVENVGNQDVPADISVSLVESPDGNPFSSQTVIGGLAAGASTVIQFDWDTAGATAGLHTLTAGHDAADDNAANDSGNIGVDVQASVTDIAILPVAAPASATQGDLVTVDVTVENVGNQNVGADIVVSLGETPDGTPFTPQTISGGLAPGASVLVSFNWDTTGASLGDHSLDVAHDLVDGNPANDSGSATVTINSPAGASTIHIADLDDVSVKLSKGAWDGRAVVTVHDDTEAVVDGVTVEGTFFQSGVAIGPFACVTSGGTCTLSSGQFPSNKGKVTFVVDSLVDGAAVSLPYAPGDNHDPDGDSDGSTIELSK